MKCYKYSKVWVLQKFSFDNFLLELEKGNVLVDFDARIGHNHRTKFYIRQNFVPNLYEKMTETL
jgi:MvaI/BcnI restriction endonuclease family